MLVKLFQKLNVMQVKLEGGKKIISIILNLVKNKIPVMGHLGFLIKTEKKFTFKGKKLTPRQNFKRCKIIRK